MRGYRRGYSTWARHCLKLASFGYRGLISQECRPARTKQAGVVAARTLVRVSRTSASGALPIVFSCATASAVFQSSGVGSEATSRRRNQSAVGQNMSNLVMK